MSNQPTNHTPPAELERFLRGEASRAEARDVVRHLLAGCPECVAATRPVWGLAEHGKRKLALRKTGGYAVVKGMESWK